MVQESGGVSVISKVMIVVANISIGGAQRIALTLTQWLMKHHIESSIVSVGNSAVNYNIPPNVNVHFCASENAKGTISIIKAMRNLFIAEKPSVVITMGVPTSIFSTLALLGTRITHVISERNDPRSFLGKSYVQKVAIWLMRLAQGYVFQTEDARTFFPKVMQKRSEVIPNPLFVQNIPDAEPTQKCFVTMGRLTKQKNHLLLLEAFKECADSLRDYELHIYGSGEMKQRTQEWIESQEADLSKRIVMHEACNDVLERIHNARAFVLSSDFEGMPNALIEAMAMGLPCISTDCPCGGPRFLIQHEVNGLLVPVNGKEEMKQAMCRVAEDEALCRALGANAKKVRETLSADKICKDWLDFCERVFERKI